MPTLETVIVPQIKKKISKKAKKRHRKLPKTPRTHKPDDMSLESWQIALRREYGRDQSFKLKNVGPHPFFSRFEVTNPQSGRTYQITIRGTKPGDNHCTCPDFAINTLGTCKHIEFVVAKLEKKRGGKRALTQGYEPDESEVYLRYDAKRNVVFQPGQSCSPGIRRLAKQYFDIDNRLKNTAYGRFERFMEKASSDGDRVNCHDDVWAFVAQVRDQASLQRRLIKAYVRGSDSPALNKLLTVSLYPYQRHGALFAAQAGRSLIADDMGLGKTIQAIAAAEILAKHGGVERVLIVCPTSLKHQWEQEIDKFTKRKLKDIQVIEGSLAKCDAMYRQDSFYKITNYDVVHRDLAAIGHWSPDLVVLDEAQRIKNWQTRTARSVKQLDSPYAIVLTGTPLENRLEELYSIVEFVDRYRLGPMFRFLDEHQHKDENGRVIGYHSLDKISRTLKPILIRRRRDQVLKGTPRAFGQKIVRANDRGTEAIPRREP